MYKKFVKRLKVHVKGHLGPKVTWPFKLSKLNQNSIATFKVVPSLKVLLKMLM